MNKNLLLFFLFIALPVVLWAQAPVIQKIEPLNSAPNARIVITGSGFSTTSAQLMVYFDHVKANIVSSTEYSIEVDVPAQAKLNNVEVINLSTQLSAKSPLKFMPSLLTETFDPTKFTTPLTFPANEELWDLCSCDLNNDGKPDIAATKFATPSSLYTPSTDIMLLQNTSTPGALGFTKLDKTNLAVLNLTFPTDNIVCGDLQGDGKPELIVTRAGSPRNSVHVFRNTSAGSVISFAPPTTLFMDNGHFATRISLRDLNLDGKPEIVVTNSFNDFFYVYQNQSSGGTLSINATPIKVSIKVNPTDALTTYDLEVQDFNGDGLPDVIINQFQTSDFYILKNQSSSSISFAAPQKFSITGGLNKITSADMNKDGKLDLVVTSTLTNQVDILLNQSSIGSFSFSSPIQVMPSSGPWGVDITDIDGDNDPDIVVASRNQSVINVLLHNGNFTIPGFTKIDIAVTNPVRNVKAGDFDGDGKPDVAYTSFTSSTASVGVIRNTNCHKPKIQNLAPVVVCNGQTIRLTTVNASNVNYTWKEGTNTVGGNNPFVDITTPGTYTVTATGEGGACAVVSDAFVVTSDASAPPGDPVITSPNQLCVGGSLSLQTNAVTNATYTWSGPNGFTSSSQNPTAFTVTDASGGFYTLQIQVGQCKSNVVSKKIDVARLANFIISSNNVNNTVCQGGSVTLSVNSTANHTYQWIKDGVDINAQTSTSLTATQQGLFTVRVTNTILNCNTETGGVTVNVLQPPVAAFQVDATSCVNKVLSFTNQSTVDTRATVVSNWNFGDGFSINTSNATHAYSTAQTFTPSLTVNYQGITGCSSSTNKNITVVASTTPSITSSATTSCPDEQVTLSVTGSFSAITWSNNATGSSISVPPGTYTVNTTDGNGCAGQASVTINALPTVNINASADPATIPLGGSSQLIATGASEYLWSPAETLDNPNINNPKATPTQTTTYVVTGTSADGCQGQTQIIVTVSGFGNFPVAFSPNGDGQNDFWNIGAAGKPDCTLTIFDSKGRRIFEKKGEDWDGTYQGKQVPEGTYYYVFGCPDQKPATGSVLVFR